VPLVTAAPTPAPAATAAATVAAHVQARAKQAQLHKRRAAVAGQRGIRRCCSTALAIVTTHILLSWVFVFACVTGKQPSDGTRACDHAHACPAPLCVQSLLV
jgi:hypothetical protein